MVGNGRDENGELRVISRWDLNKFTRDVFDAVENEAATFMITKHGRPVALLCPLPEELRPEPRTKPGEPLSEEEFARRCRASKL